MSDPTNRYFFARPSVVWHLILHGLTRFRSPIARPGDGTVASGEEGRSPTGAQRIDGGPMNITPWYLAALAPFAAIGYSGAYLGHAVVIMLTMGIFFGTL